jgi:hypothetical protein
MGELLLRKFRDLTNDGRMGDIASDTLLRRSTHGSIGWGKRNAAKKC